MSTSTWNVKISELGATTNFSTGDEFVIVQNGETVKIAGNSLANSIATLTNLATRSYVDAVVDMAPGTLDTLRELAQAINNDPNFAGNITEAINSKVGFDEDGLINFANGGQVGNVQIVHQGQDQYYNGMDLYSPAGHEWVQLNYNDKNYVWVTESFVGIDLTTTQGNWISWVFDMDGNLNLPSGGDILRNGASVLNPVVNVPTVLNDFTDVIITSPQQGQVLKWDGQHWVNGADATGSGGGSIGSDPAFNSVTVTQLNVQNVEFTGTGAVTISSGNDLNFEAAGSITLNGQSVITKAELKAIVAASTDFADFKARIALL
jgi:hypothetical protein